MARLEWHIARRYLAARRKGKFLSLITLIAIAGVFVGVMALITVIAVMTGLQQDLQAKILGANPHVYVFEQGNDFRMDDWRPVLAEARGMSGVMAADPFVLTTVGVTLFGSDYAQPGALYGIDASDSTSMTEIENGIRSGELTLETGSGMPGLLIGSRLADRIHAYPGDTVTIGALENLRRGPLGGYIPRMMQFQVTDRFTTGMYQYDSQNMYAALPAVQELLGIGESVSGIAVNVGDPWRAHDVALAINEELGFPYWTSDWMSLNQSLFSALKLEKYAMGLILFLIVLVASFNIISTLIMVVADKTREIGILKSMGLTDGGVLRIFMVQGLTIGIVGTVLGALGGLGLVALLERYEFISLPGDVYFIDTLPVALNPLDLGLILLLSVVVAFAATIYPARQASRLAPVEAIRHE